MRTAHSSNPTWFRLESSDAAATSFVSWDGIDLRQVYTIVQWCFNLEWLLRNSAVTESEKQEVGNSLRDLLHASRPIYQNVDQHQTVIVPRTNGFKMRRKSKVVPDCTERQTNVQAESSALRDIYKWQYQLCTGERWSTRNTGATRGFHQFLSLWERFYEKMKEADGDGKRLRCSFGEIAVVDDLNELMGLAHMGRHDRDAVSSFCRKVLDEKVLKRVKNFVDEYEG